MSQGLWPFQISCTIHSPIRKNPARNFPRSFFIRPRRLNPWTVKSCRSDLGHSDAQLVVYRFKLGLKRQCWNRPKQITLAFFHSALRAKTLPLTASQAHYFQTSSLFLFSRLFLFHQPGQIQRHSPVAWPMARVFRPGNSAPSSEGGGGNSKKRSRCGRPFVGSIPNTKQLV